MSSSTASAPLRCRDIALQKIIHVYEFVTQVLIPSLQKLPNHTFFRTWKFKRSSFIALILLASLVLYKIEVERQKKHPKEGKPFRKSSNKSIHKTNHKKIKKSISQLSFQKPYESHT